MSSAHVRRQHFPWVLGIGVRRNQLCSSHNTRHNENDLSLSSTGKSPSTRKILWIDCVCACVCVCFCTVLTIFFSFHCKFFSPKILRNERLKLMWKHCSCIVPVTDASGIHRESLVKDSSQLSLVNNFSKLNHKYHSRFFLSDVPS